MSVNITIGTQTIPFPTAGTDPSWAENLVDFALAVEETLSGIANAFNVVPRVLTLNLDGNTNLEVPAANFPHASVRSFAFTYAIYRTNSVTTIIETGSVNGVYNTAASSWTLQREFSGDRQADGTSYAEFSMSGDQLQLSTTALGGSYDSTNSRISYEASVLLISN